MLPSPGAWRQRIHMVSIQVASRRRNLNSSSLGWHLPLGSSEESWKTGASRGKTGRFPFAASGRPRAGRAVKVFRWAVGLVGDLCQV